MRARRLRIAAALLAALAALWLLDRPLFHWLYVGSDDAIQKIEERDWYKTLRVAGTLLPWIFIAAAMTLADARTAATRAPGLLILAAAALSGLAAEVLKILTGRLRPKITDGVHQYKGLVERFTDTSNSALPSSHAAVAFGAAFMVAFLYPRAGWVALAAAAGCGYTRMISGAHFATDVFVGAVVGYASASLLRPRERQRGLLLP